MPVTTATQAGTDDRVMTDTTTFLLVHGSWQGGWVWHQVGRRLRAHGHRVLTPTLPGHHPNEDRALITHQDYVAAVCDTLDAVGTEPVVLVGHSLGGMVISQVADRRPDRIARLVYYAAFVLGDDEALGDVMPAQMRLALQQLAATSPDRSMPMPRPLWHDSFLQTADHQLIRHTFDRLVPEPYRPVFEPIHLSQPTSELAIPLTFLSARQDRTMPPGFWHPHMSSRLGHPQTIEIDGDHQVLLSAPDRLTDALLSTITTGAPAQPAITG